MDRMLQFNPEKRLSVADCLKHPYLKKYQSELPPPPPVVDFSFEKAPMSKPILQALFMDEINAIKKTRGETLKVYEERKKAKLGSSMHCALFDTLL